MQLTNWDYSWYNRVLVSGTNISGLLNDSPLGCADALDNLLVRIHFIIVIITCTGLAPWEFEFPFPGSLTSTFLVCRRTGTTKNRQQMLWTCTKKRCNPQPSTLNPQLSLSPSLSHTLSLYIYIYLSLSLLSLSLFQPPLPPC